MAEDQKDMKSTMDASSAEAGDARIYEVGYLLAPTVSEEDVPAMYGNLKELVSAAGGQVISDDMPKMIGLAYTMTKVVKNVRQKFNTAYFGWIKFALESGSVADLKKKLDGDPSIIRFLIMKTVRENTIAARRFVHREGMRRRPAAPRPEGAPAEAPAEINKEEIDKEIEAMVA